MITGGESRRSRKEACALLAELVQQELAVVLTVEEVDRLFDRHWLRLTCMAHMIHEGYRDEPSNAMKAAMAGQP